MIDLSTTYLGLKLKNPIIVGACPKTGSVGEIKELADNGAAAIVLKSLYEEQINDDLAQMSSVSNHEGMAGEADDYLNFFVKQNSQDTYLQLIRDAKKAVSIPIIASLNCSSFDEWLVFTQRIEEAGADALEINVSIMPTDSSLTSNHIEAIYFNVVSEIRKYVKIPIALKLTSTFTGLAHIIKKLSQTNINGLVLFNRFYTPDIDLVTEEVVAASIYTTPQDIYNSLRWIGVMANETECDLAASGGVHDGYGAMKCILAGAKAVQVVSTLYNNGPQQIGLMLKEIEGWMNTHHYKKLESLIGKLSHDRVNDPVFYERMQFIKHFTQAK